MSDWKRCEGMHHVGDERDETVEWHDLGLLCATCAAAYDDTRPLRAEVKRLLSELAQRDLDHLGTMHEMAAVIDQLRYDVTCLLFALKVAAES